VERGESSISIETLISLCKALGVSADSLIMDVQEIQPSASDKRDTLFTMLKNASDAELDFLISYIKLYRGLVKI
jgi:transcriptional regulator with XRE-family HTH domain